ncbi:hypothetical protein BC939DRAFT_443427 [Gamsiella multidivaricata]|uniref:uncharacterized protein n=1 Tax=Gamsiella multidivaricata TaxID=101098 RepID=UPI0022208361|nr:uncharacterized protein BC939DRAFT_443427 [Gamsiella multidivaricata]KAG0367360.1 hypothetical protein BGZ54_003989 [Gamsiella multidivaricata]KAI7828623.1 hypothetical protein BC939DRAFT_443427 [Gamsiella multidivaricata]
MEEEEEICRVCRSEGTPEQPLFHPCKCSGTIRFVHQDCLLEWLEHSNKRYCELCKHNFSFTPIYSPEMPEAIPKRVLIGRAVEKLSKAVQLVLRGIIVIWVLLVMLPYFTIWIWRLYFWIGETFAFRANGLETPMWNSTTFFASRHNLTLTRPSTTAGNERAVDGITVLFLQALAPEHQWISKFILDCFEGQIIISVVVVVFMAIFLLREWVRQNRDGDLIGMPMDDPAAPVPEVEAEAQGFNMEQAVERFIAAQHHIEAVVEGDVDLSEDDDDEEDMEVDESHTNAPSHLLNSTTEPWNLMDFRYRSEAAESEGSSTAQGHRAPFFWETASASTSNTNNDIQRGSGSDWMGESQGSSDALNGEGSSSGSKTLQDGRGDSIFSKDGTPLYWKSGIPLTHQNVYLNEDGSVMSLHEMMARYDDLCQDGNLEAADIQRLPTPWRHPQMAQAQQPLEEHAPGMGFREEQRQEMIRRINERGIRTRLRHDVANEPEWNPAQGAAPPRPLVIPHPVPAAPAVPPPPPPAPIAVNQDDDLDDPNAEELDGILEVIGINGSIWQFLQVSLLMSALVCASLGLGVWIPYMIGKTILLMNPLNVLRVPLAMLSRLTDPILDYVFDRVLPYAGAGLSKAMAMFESTPLEMLYQEHVLPAWNAIIEIGAFKAAQDVYSKDATAVAVESLITSSDATVITNTTVIHHVVRKWTEIAYGTSSGDKFVAIAIGYAICFALASWYFTRAHHAYGHTFSRGAREFLRQQGLVLKIAFFVAIEMVVFPLFCGIVIGLSTLPLFKGASITSRVAFYRTLPNWSLIMHWLIGTAFMFNFSFFVGLCRRMVRPGVMWFIRDPNDEEFHPVREILERPILHQLRKLGSGAIMYFTLIILGITLTIHSLNLLMKGVLPLRWPLDEPISDLPVDLLLFHLVFPLTARWLNPAVRLKAIFATWWRKLAHWLRLSSFMYASEGQRFYDEEGHFVYRSWKAWFLRWRPPIPGAEDMDETMGSGEELDIDAPVIFVRNGGLLRVPNSDHILHLKDRRVLVPVDENGNALDPKEDLPGEIDPFMELQIRRRDDLIDPKHNTIVVYAPPHFNQRLIAFVVLLWISVSMFLALSVVVPMIVGRAVFKLKSERQVHDIYSVLVGVYVLRGLWSVLHWSLSTARYITSHGLQPIDPKAQLRTAWNMCRLAMKLLYFGITFGVILPFILGLMVELFVILPLRNALEGDSDVIFAVNWAVGLLYMKIIHRILSVMPNNRFAADMNRVFNGTNVNDWDTRLATRRLIIPIFGMVTLAIAGPFVLGWIAAEGLGLTGAARLKVFRQAYPVAMVLSLVVFGLKESLVILRGWSQYVRDQEYLVGRQLHNLQVEEPETPNAAVEAPDLAEETAILEEQQQQEERHAFWQQPDATARESSVERQEDTIDEETADLTRAHREQALAKATAYTNEQKYAPSLLRSNSRRVKDPPIGSDDDDEGESIAYRTRLRRSRRLQTQEEALNTGQSSSVYRRV